MGFCEKYWGRTARKVQFKRELSRCVAETLEKRQLLTATQLFWDPQRDPTPTGGPGVWDTSISEWLNPSGQLVAWSNTGDANGPYQAVFPANSGGVTLGASVCASGISFATDGYSIIDNTGTYTLTLSGSQPSIDIVPSATATISSSISAPNGLTLTDAGTLNLTGSVGDGSSALQIAAGTLSASGSQSWSSIQVDSSANLVLGATADVQCNSLMDDGSITQTGGGVSGQYLYVGTGAAAGAYTQSGGSVSFLYEYLSEFATSSSLQSDWTQTGGTNYSDAFTEGFGGQTNGTYDLDGGIFGSNQCVVGFYCSGQDTFEVQQGNAVIDTLTVGYIAGTSSVVVSGGSLVVDGNAYVGYSTAADFNQNGGNVSVTDSLIISGDGLAQDPAGIGSYELSGASSTLTTGYTDIGYSARGSLTQTGGTFDSTNALILDGPAGTIGTFTSAGGTYSAGVTIDVLKPTASGASLVNEGDTYNLGLSATSNYGGNAITSWDVNWGDGLPDSTPPGSATSVPHRFLLGDQTRSIHATAYGGGDSFASPPNTVVVQDVPATITPLNAPSVNINSNLTISTSFTDPGTQETHTATVFWGDGSASQASITESDGSGTLTAAHIFSTHGSNGQYSAFIEMSDSEGAVTLLPFTVQVLYLPDLPAVDQQQPSANPGVPPGANVFNPPVEQGGAAPATNTPVIAASNIDGQPDDTLTLTGANLSVNGNFSDTEVTVFGQTNTGNADLADASIQDAEDNTTNGLLATIPASEPASSAYLVWVQNANGYSAPVVVNQTDAQWMEPRGILSSGYDNDNVQITCAAEGTTVSVYGRNLASAAGQTWIFLQQAGAASGTWISTTSPDFVSANSYEVQFKVPGTLSVGGTYQVWVNNGEAGTYGWSLSPAQLVIEAANAAALPFVCFNAPCTTVDYGPLIQTAIDNLTLTGGTLYFPKGTYNVYTCQTEDLVLENIQSGSFELQYGSQLTTSIPYSDNTASMVDQIQAALTPFLPTGGSVTVSYNPSDPEGYAAYQIQFGFVNTEPVYLSTLHSSLEGTNYSAYVVSATDQITADYINITLLGAGGSSSIINFIGPTPNEGSGTFNIGAVDYTDTQNLTFQSLGLIHNDDFNDPPLDVNPHNSPALIRAEGWFDHNRDNMSIDNCDLVSGDQTVIDWTGARSSSLLNSTVIGPTIFMNGVEDATLYDDHFYQDFGQLAPVVRIYSGIDVSITDCLTENYYDYLVANNRTPSSTANMYGEGKFVEFYGQPMNDYFADNQSINLGEYSPPVDSNSGEQVLVDSPDSATGGASSDPAIDSVSGNTITVDGSFAAPLYQTLFVDVTSGAAMGEHIAVQSVQQTNGTTILTLPATVAVMPAVGDYININCGPANMVFFDNTLDHTSGSNAGLDTASTGFNINGGYGIVVDDNTVNNATVGVGWHATGGTQPVSMIFDEIINNHIEVPEQAYNEAVGILFISVAGTRPDATAIGVEVEGNSIFQNGNTYGFSQYSGPSTGIGLPGFGVTSPGPAGPGTFIAVEHNFIQGQQIGLGVANDSDVLAYKNTLDDDAEPVLFNVSSSSLLLYQNNYTNDPAQLYWVNPGATYTIPGPTLDLPLHLLYATFDGSPNPTLTVSIENQGATTLVLPPANASFYFSVTSPTGSISISPGQAVAITVSVGPIQILGQGGVLPLGSYTMEFQLFGSGTTAVTISVEFTVTA
jgi:hypothetical protein